MKFVTASQIAHSVAGPDGLGAGWIRGVGHSPDVYVNAVIDGRPSNIHIRVTVRVAGASYIAEGKTWALTIDGIKALIGQVALAAINHG